MPEDYFQQVGVPGLLDLLDRAVKKSGLAESTFCVKVLGKQQDFRDRLTEGRVTLRMMTLTKQRLETYLGQTE